MVRVVLADSDHFSLAAINRFLESALDIEIIETCQTVADASKCTVKHKPEILLVEATILEPDSAEALELVRHSSPQTKTVLLTSEDVRSLAFRAYHAGFSGLLSKRTISKELPGALRVIAAGYKIYAQPHNDQEPTPRAQHRTIHNNYFEALAERDRQLVTAVASGLTNSQVARSLHISEGLVKLKLATIMDQLRITNRVQLAVIATEYGLITSAELRSR